jgi:signal transduction protein with GAF and PtsI domain
MPDDRQAIRMHVHERDDLRVDGILRLIEAASEPGPLSKVLQRMCGHAATIAHADVVSVYVREQADDGDSLVLRANVGFPDSAINKVHLAMGEGITGTAAEVMRPISAQVAQEDEHYKHFSELGEERFPSLLAIPLMARGMVAGVLVLQRSEAAAFADTEVALGTALATTFSHAIEHRGDASRAPSRSARLTGNPCVPGTALGRALMLGTLEALRPGRSTAVGTGDAPELHIDESFETVGAILHKAERRVMGDLPAPARATLGSLLLMLDDQRLRTIAQERCTQHGIAAGLRQVAREYAVATYTAGAGDPLLEQRAIEVESLCLLLATIACGLPLPSPGEVLVVAERLPAIATLAVVGGRAAAVVASGPLPEDSLGVAIARAAEVPVLADVPGLFAWVRPDDTLLVDCSAGLLRVNPPATTIARYRHARESQRPTEG